MAIPLINDNIQESREWFLVEVGLPADQDGVRLGLLVTTNVTVVDDDRKQLTNAQSRNEFIKIKQWFSLYSCYDSILW